MMKDKAECILLAGGFGTRLQGVIGSVPKCMALVAGQPFIYYILKYIERQNIHRVVISLGYLSVQVTDWLSTQQFSLDIDWVIESEPLGTGGGIHFAMKKCKSEKVFVLNGDTFFGLAFEDLIQLQERSGAETCLGIKHMENAERYGLVQIEESGLITGFLEKRPGSGGLINGGVYLIDRKRFMDRKFPDVFSFEKEYLEACVAEGCFYGLQSEGYFIDIGIPADYERAQQEFATLLPS